MPTLIKLIRNRNLIEFDKGTFDAWCVFLTRPGQKRYAPLDTEYFSRLRLLGTIHGHEKIYRDFICFYNPTSKSVDNKILDHISELSFSYGDDSEEIDIWFTVIYAGMIAEENKAHAILKKRIKRLGMHQVLIEGLDPTIAANYSKGKPWRELDGIMKERGF